jgi:hypothetical protein
MRGGQSLARLWTIPCKGLGAVVRAGGVEWAGCPDLQGVVLRGFAKMKGIGG